ncbi:uncharacterized protein LOC117123557 [Anneissia japonica]|uniref:uncharacterized protein LOC117123557 n=1 Tax=Anneissia japonica TaxID=1529436 RepID=UPI0014255905|nr:uncharacterized protein LOC117123557 [Anneissia japonica]
MSSYFVHSLANGGYHHGTELQGQGRYLTEGAQHYQASTPPITVSNYSYNYNTQVDSSFYAMNRSSNLSNPPRLSHTPQTLPETTNSERFVPSQGGMANWHGVTPPRGGQAATEVKGSQNSPGIQQVSPGIQSPHNEHIYPWMRRVHSSTGKFTYNIVSVFTRPSINGYCLPPHYLLLHITEKGYIFIDKLILFQLIA